MSNDKNPNFDITTPNGPKKQSKHYKYRANVGDTVVADTLKT